MAMIRSRVFTFTLSNSGGGLSLSAAMGNLMAHFIF
jgi:hypothetical protein